MTPTMFQVLFSPAFLYYSKQSWGKHFYSHFTGENLRQRFKEASQVIWLLDAFHVAIFSTPEPPWRLQGLPHCYLSPTVCHRSGWL